jgi:hypothetical protein
MTDAVVGPLSAVLPVMRAKTVRLQAGANPRGDTVQLGRAPRAGRPTRSGTTPMNVAMVASDVDGNTLLLGSPLAVSTDTRPLERGRS